VRLFVCEYVTGGGLSGAPLPAGLRREGDMMLGALVKDLGDVPGMEVVSTRDARLPVPDLPASFRPIGAGEDPWPVWRRLAEEVDAVWPVAPETAGALERLSELALAAGARLLGSRPAAVRLAASKRATAERLAARGIAAVPTWPAAQAAELPDATASPGLTRGWVAKPDDGAGAEDTHYFRRLDDLVRWLDACPAPNGFVVQPYVPGTPASLSLLCRDGRARLLACNRQDVVIEAGRFRYRGGTVGGLEARRPAFAPIAAAVAAAIPGLWGHVGVDLVDGADGPVVLDVNPRLTTSYVGLKAATGTNPVALALDLLESPIAEIERPLRVTAQAVAVEAADD